MRMYFLDTHLDNASLAVVHAQVLGLDLTEKQNNSPISDPTAFKKC